MRLRSRGRACSLAFVTAAVTLFVQVLVHRVISAKLFNNFAFLVISLTMLGFALSGVLLSRILGSFLRRLDDAVAISAALFGLTTLAATAAFYHADVFQAAHSRPELVLSFLRTMPYALVFAVPFACCGLILGALLAAPELPARRIYFWDLLGSAVGAFAVIPAIAWLGAERGLLAASAVLLAGSVLLATPRSTVARTLAAVAGLALALAWAFSGRVFDMRYPRGTLLAELQATGGDYGVETIVWDPVARIEVSRIPPLQPATSPYRCLVGPNPALHARFKRVLTQNNTAWTYALEYDGSRESLAGVDETIYAAAYQARSVLRPRVGIIGVGGGFDVLNAIYFDASHITGVEVNAATVRLLTTRYRDYFRPWVEDPRLHLVLGEGRHYLATTRERFDVLQLSGVDSYSGTAGAAHVFSESYLYTAEAFDLYLSRLTERGILNLMRLEYIPPREMLRALVTGVEALRRAGVTRPAEHVVMLTAEPDPTFSALLVKRTPFAADEIRRLTAWAAANPYLAVSAAPGMRPDASPYQRFLALADPPAERAFVASYPWNISPAVDDRPFFFNHSFWWHLFPADPAVWASPPFMETGIVILGLVIGLATLVCIVLPLRHLAGGAPATPVTRRHGLFFAGAGLGYMAVEIALLQKFGLLLGHPNYALSVVLAALLLASGVGSLLSAQIARRLGGVRGVSLALAVVVLTEWWLVFPRLPGLATLPLGVRVAIVFALVAPIGLCLGTFVPTAIERLKPEAPAYVPWAWGLNGILSVLSPVASVAFSMTWGINALLIAALPVYLLTALALPPAASAAAASAEEVSSA